MHTDPETKGDIGEFITASSLRKYCNMQTVRNVYFPYKTHLAEIDIIGVHSSGIYIIENKNYSGNIRGSIDDKYWTVKYPYSSERLYNPILQNRIHCSALLNSLEDIPIINRYKLYSVVIFNDASRLELKGCNSVFTLKDFINNFESCSLEERYTNEEVQELTKLFRLYSNQSDSMKLIHKNLLEKGEKTI
jgi:hypothetical protein